VGAQLFHRRPRGVELTAAGRVFLDNARAMLAQYEHTFEATRRAARGEQGRLLIGVPPTAPFHPLVPFSVRAFRETYPQVSLSMEELLRTELLDRLRNEQIDVAFLLTPMTEAQGVVIHPLLTEPMLVALPMGHALARGARGAPLALKALAEETFIVYAREHGPAIYDATIAACLEAGFSPRLGQEAPRITSALSLVAAGLGVSIVPASMQRMAMHGVAYRRLKGAAQPTAALQLATRRSETSPVVRNFVSLVRKATRSRGDCQ
jgi:DNA-binding transcriptional LysR family regulator